MIKYKVKKVMLDGKEQYKLQCPGCKIWGLVDEDQYHGRVSILCGHCKFHKTVDLSKEAEIVQ